MPFLSGNIDAAQVRPRSRVGKLVKSSSTTAAGQRGYPASAPKPEFIDSNLETQLYSSPPPPEEQQDVAGGRMDLRLRLKKFQVTSLEVPLEQRGEEEFAQRSPLDNYRSMSQNSGLGQLGSAFWDKKNKLHGTQDEDMALDGALQINEMRLPPIPKPTQRLPGDRLRVVTQQPAKAQGKADEDRGQEKMTTQDKIKQLEQQSKNSVMHIKESKSISHFGKQLDQRIQAPKTSGASQPAAAQKVQQSTPIGEYILQSRAQKRSEEPSSSAGAIKSQQQQNEADAHAQRVLQSLVTPIEALLPVFRCIAMRLQMEEIAARGGDLSEFFRKNQIKINFASQLEAKQQGADYFANTQKDLLQQAPDALASLLTEKEFVYLTYDSPSVRKMILAQYVNKSTDLYGCYTHTEEGFNSYELILCNFSQVNPECYFTLSGRGIAQIQKDTESNITPLADWERERRIFLDLKKKKFFARFIEAKAIRIWYGQIRHQKFVKNLSALQRTSLLCDQSYVVCLKDLARLGAFEFKLLRQRAFSFYGIKDYIARNYMGSSQQVQKLMQQLRPYLTDVPEGSITLRQFTLDFRQDLIAFKAELNAKLVQIIEVLMGQCQFIQQQIQERIMAQSEKNQKYKEQEVLQAVANAASFNVMKLKALVRLCDYMIAEALISFIVEVNRQLFRLFFGIYDYKLEEAAVFVDETVSDEEQQRINFAHYQELTGRPLVRNPAYVQQYLQESSGDAGTPADELQQRGAPAAAPAVGRPSKNLKNEITQLLDTPTQFYMRYIAYVRKLQLDTLFAKEPETPLEPQDAKEFRFDRNVIQTQQGIAQLETKEPDAELVRALTPASLELFQKERAWLENIPLVCIQYHTPSAPVFVVQVVCNLSQEVPEIVLEPSADQFLAFLGDSLAELATVCQKAIRPVQYQRLANFLQEATRLTDLKEFQGLQIKDALGQTEDYIQTAQQLKWGIQYAYKLAVHYLSGLDAVLLHVVNVLESFTYDADAGAFYEPGSALKALERLSGRFPSRLAHDGHQGLHLCFCLLAKQAKEPFKTQEAFFEQIAFPGLSGITDASVRGKFGLPSTFESYVNEFVTQESPYAVLATVLQPQHFKDRIAALEELLIYWKRAGAVRGILCFSVDSTEFQRQIESLLLNLVGFVRNLIPLALKECTERLERQFDELITTMTKAPDSLQFDAAGVGFPSAMQMNDSLLDFSELQGQYAPGKGPVASGLYAAVDKAEEVLEQYYKEQRVQQSAQIQQQQHSQPKKGKEKRDKKKTRESLDAMLVEDEHSASALDKHILAKPYVLALQAIRDTLAREVPNWKGAQKGAVEALKPSSQLILKLLAQKVDYDILELTQETICAYEIAKRQYGIFRAFDGHIVALQAAGVSLGVITEMSVPICGEKAEEMLERRGFGSSITEGARVLREAINTYAPSLSNLDKALTQFGARRQRLYLSFQQNLLCIYLDLMQKVQLFLSEVLEHQNDFFWEHAESIDENPRAVLDQRIVDLDEDRRIKTPSGLFLFLLFQKEFGLKVVKEQLFQIDCAEETLAGLLEDTENFRKSLRLFETTDFYVPDQTERKLTEIDHCLQLCAEVIRLKKAHWTCFQKLQNFIQGDCSKPLILLDMNNFKAALTQLHQELTEVKHKYDALIAQAIEHVNGLSFDVEKNRVLRIDQPDVIQYYSPEMEPEEFEANRTDAYLSFSSLKLIYFVYKAHCYRLQATVLHENEALNQEAIEEFTAQIEQKIRAQDFAADPEPPMLKFSELDLLKTDFQVVKFNAGAKAALQVFLSPRETLNTSLQMVEMLQADVEVFQRLYSVALQPKHFVELATYMETPDLVFELNNWETFLRLNAEEYGLAVMDLMSKDKENAYRSLFGPSGDGISEFLTFASVFAPRKDIVQKVQLQKLPLALRLDTVSGFFAELERTRYGESDEEYAHTLARMQKDLQMQQAIGQKSESDVEMQGDVELMETKKSAQHAVVQLGQHLEAVRGRCFEILSRRHKKRQSRHHLQTLKDAEPTEPGVLLQPSKLAVSSTQPGGQNQKEETAQQQQQQQQQKKIPLSLELDRLSVSVSRLIYRGLYFNGDGGAKARALINRAFQEYLLLEELAVLQRGIKTARLSFRTVQLAGQDETLLKLYVLNDPTELISFVQDRMIHLSALRIKASRMRENAEVVLEQLRLLEEQVKTSLECLESLMQYQQQFFILMDAFTPGNQIFKAQPDEARLFVRVSKLFLEAMQGLYESGLFLSCTGDLLNLISQKLLPDSRQIQSALQNYIVVKRQLFTRFFFLSDRMLCNFLCIQFTDSHLEQAISTLAQSTRLFFDNVDSTQLDASLGEDGQRRYQIASVTSREAERLQIRPVSTKQHVEVWAQQLEQQIQMQIKAQIQQIYNQALHTFHDMITYPDSVTMNEKSYQAFIESASTQAVCLVRECATAKFLLNWVKFNDKSFFSKRARAQPDELIKKVSLAQVIDVLVVQQEQLVGYLVSAMRQGLPADQMARYNCVMQTELQLRDELLQLRQANSLEDSVTIWPIYDEVAQGVYLSQLRTEVLRPVISQSKGGPFSDLLQQYQYKYEFQGAVVRPVRYDYMREVQGHAFQTSFALFTGPRGAGKTTTAIDLSRRLGQFSFVLLGQNTTDPLFAVQTIQGACIQGTSLVIDRADELAPDMLGVIAVILRDIRAGIQAHAAKVFMAGTGVKLSPSVRIIATATRLEQTPTVDAYQFQHQFRVLCITRPQTSVIYCTLLKQLGFLHADDIALKIAQTFKFLQREYIPFLSEIDVSFHKIRQLAHLVGILYKQWTGQLRENEKLAELLGPRLPQKQQKEQLQFCMYLEQYVVIQAFNRLFTSAMDLAAQQQFAQMLGGIFDPDLVSEAFSTKGEVLKTTFALQKLRKTATFVVRQWVQMLNVKQQITSGQDGNGGSQDGAPDLKQQLEEEITQVIDFKLTAKKDKKKDEVTQSEQLNIMQAQNLIQHSLTKQQAGLKEIYYQHIVDKNKFILPDQTKYFLQVEQALWIRSGVILFGPASCGKTAIWTNALDESNVSAVIRPEMHTIKQLIGHFNNGYFINGILPDIILRFLAFKPNQELLRNGMTTAGIRFLHFDGPISSELGDVLNSMLDDSHVLELPSGDKIYLNNYIRFVFEVQSIKDLPASLISRCAVVKMQKQSELWKTRVLSFFRQQFTSEFQSFQENFAFDHAKMEFVSKFTRPPSGSTLSQRVSRVKSVIHERFKQAVRQDMQYANNYYGNLLELFMNAFSQLETAVSRVQGAPQIDADVLVCHSLNMFQQYIEDDVDEAAQGAGAGNLLSDSLRTSQTLRTSTLTAVGSEKPVQLRRLKARLLLSVVYGLSRQIPQALIKAQLRLPLSELCLAEFKTVAEALQIEPPQQLDQCFYDAERMLPMRFMDATKPSFRYQALNRSHNSMTELEVLSVDFIDGSFLIQTAELRYEALHLFDAVSKRLVNLIEIDSTLKRILTLQASLQGPITIRFDCRLNGPDALAQIFLDNSIVQGNTLLLKEKFVVLIEHFADAEQRLVGLVRFMAQNKKLYIFQNEKEVLYEIPDFLCVVDGPCSFADLCFQCKEPDLKRIQMDIRAVIFAWAAQFSQGLLPSIGSLCNFLQHVLEMAEAHLNVFSAEHASRMLASFVNIGPQSFQAYCDAADANNAMTVKRYLFLALVALLRVEYFEPLGVDPRAANQVMRDSAERCMAQQLPELKPQPGQRGKACTHPVVLMQDGIGFITGIPPVISQGGPLIKSSPSTANPSMINSSTQNSMPMVQDATLLSGIRKALSPEIYTRPATKLFFYEPEWRGQWVELCTLSQELPSNLPKPQTTFSSPKLAARCSSQIPEVQERFGRLGYLLQTRKCVQILNCEMEEVSRIISEIAVASGYKLLLVGMNMTLNEPEESGVHTDTEQTHTEAQKVAVTIYDHLVQQLRSLVEKSFDSLQTSLQYLQAEPLRNQQLQAAQKLSKIVLVVPPEVSEDPRSQKLLSALILQNGWGAEEIYSEKVFTAARRIDDSLSNLQIREILRSILADRLHIVLVSNGPAFSWYQKMFRGVSCAAIERPVHWSFQSIVSAASQDGEVSNLQTAAGIFKETVEVAATSSGQFQHHVRSSLLTPVFLRRFLSRSASISKAKQEKIQATQAALQKALDTLRVAAEESALLEVKIREKRPGVEARKAQADRLSQELSGESSRAVDLRAALRGESQVLQTQLAGIRAERAQAQQQLDEIQPVMAAATDALYGLTRNDAAEVGSVQNPSALMQQTVQAICVLLGEQTAWASAKLVVGRGDFISRVLKLNPREIPAKQMKAFKALADAEEFSVEKVSAQSKACGALASWAKAFSRYAEVLEQAGPRLERVEKLEAAFAEKDRQYQEKTAILKQLEEKIAALERQSAENQAQLAALQASLNELTAQAEKLLRIQRLLDSQKDTWEALLAELNQKLAELQTTAFLMAAYDLFQQTGAGAEEGSGSGNGSGTGIGAGGAETLFAKITGAGKFTVEYLIRQMAEPEEVLQISRFASAADSYTELGLLNAAQIKKPLVLDRDDQFVSYCKNAARGRQKLTLLKDGPSIRNELTQALTAGDFTIVLVDANAPSLAALALWNGLEFNLTSLVTQDYAMVKREVRLETGQTVEVHPRFQIVLVDQCTDFHGLTASSLSQFQVMQFKKQELTVMQQFLQILLDTRAKDTQAKYFALLDKKAASATELAVNERLILQKLGGINLTSQAEQDVVLEELERLISKQGDIAATLKDIAATEKEIQTIKTSFEPDAALLASLFTVLQQVSGYSLNMFVRYMRAFPKTAQLIQYVLRSVDERARWQVQIRYVFASHIRSLAHKHDASLAAQGTLLQMIQVLLLNPDAHFVTSVNGGIVPGRFSFAFDDSDAEVQEQTALLFQDKRELLGAEELHRRKAIIGVLLHGLFKRAPTGDEPVLKSMDSFGKMPGKPQEISLKGLSTAVIVTSHGTPNTQFDTSLQLAINKVVIQCWQKVFLQLFKPDADVPALAREAGEQISSNYNLHPLIQKYFQLLLIKLFQPKALDNALHAFLGEQSAVLDLLHPRHPQDSPPGELLARCDALRLVLGEEAEGVVIQHVVDYLGKKLSTKQKLETLEWSPGLQAVQVPRDALLIVRQKITPLDMYKLQPSTSADQQECGFKMLFTAEAPCEVLHYYCSETVDFATQFTGISGPVLERLKLQTNISDSSSASTSLQRVFQMLEFKTARQIGVSEAQGAVENLKEELIFSQGSVAAPGIVNSVKFISGMIGNKLERRSFNYIVNKIIALPHGIAIPEQLSPHLKDILSQSVYANLIVSQAGIVSQVLIQSLLIPSPTKKPNASPIQAFLLQEAEYFNALLSAGQTPPNNAKQIKAYLSQIIKADVPKRIELDLLLRPGAAFQAMFLQAAWLYGGSSTDYQLCAGTDPSDSDVVLTGLTLRGASFESGAVQLRPASGGAQPGEKQLQFKIVAQRTFKRRLLNLPLAKPEPAAQHIQAGGAATAGATGTPKLGFSGLGTPNVADVLRRSHSAMQTPTLSAQGGTQPQSPGVGIGNAGKATVFEKRLNQFLSYQQPGLFRTQLCSVQVLRRGAPVWALQMSCGSVPEGVDLIVEGVWIDV